MLTMFTRPLMALKPAAASNAFLFQSSTVSLQLRAFARSAPKVSATSSSSATTEDNPAGLPSAEQFQPVVVGKNMTDKEKRQR